MKILNVKKFRSLYEKKIFTENDLYRKLNFRICEILKEIIKQKKNNMKIYSLRQKHR